MAMNFMKMFLGLALIGYSYACFCKPDWVAWISAAPILEKRNPLTSFMLVGHGLISGIAGLALVFTCILKLLTIGK